MSSSATSDEAMHGKVMELALRGSLGREDSNLFVREAGKMIREHRRLRLLVTMHDFHGRKLETLWEDYAWNNQHFAHVERLAVVGEASWRDLMTGFYKPFATAQARFYTLDQIDAAHAWINE